MQLRCTVAATPEMRIDTSPRTAHHHERHITTNGTSPRNSTKQTSSHLTPEPGVLFSQIQVHSLSKLIAILIIAPIAPVPLDPLDRFGGGILLGSGRRDGCEPGSEGEEGEEHEPAQG